MIIKTDLVNKVITDIAPKYFDADEFSDITKSRIGLFGIISETMGTIFENSVINNAIKARERLTITASRDTLLKEAAGYPELAIPHAKPASINLFIGIPLKYLHDRFMIDSSTIEFTLQKDTLIQISSFNYLLDYSIRIIGRQFDGRFTYGAQYLIDNENPLSMVSNPYLVSFVRNIDGEEYLMCNVIVSQLSKQYEYYNIIETEPIPLNGIDFEYEGQLAYFNVFYKEPNSDEYTLVEKIEYYSKLTSANKFIYYNDSMPGTIRIYIPDSFDYLFNSEIRLDIYTTQGTRANFRYTTGTVEVAPQSYNDQYDYTGSYFQTVVVGDSVGGVDSLTTDEIRSMVINYKSTLRGIDTENDLNTFFSETDQINNMIFIKKRIDVFERLYTAFMILRDDNHRIIPTNSLNMHLTEDDIDFYYPQTQRRVILPTAAYSLRDGKNFEVQKNILIEKKVSKIRLRLSGSNVDNNAQIRLIEITDSNGNILPLTDFAVSQGENSDGGLNLDDIANAFDSDDSTFWTMGEVTEINPNNFIEAIFTLNTPAFISSIKIASDFDTIKTYPMGSIEIQYETIQDSNPTTSKDTWVDVLSPREFIVGNIDDADGNTYSNIVPVAIDDTKVSIFEEDENKFLFGSPYLMVINEDPPSVSFYMNSVDRDSVMQIEYSNEDTPVQFIINTININRNAIIGEETYKINVNVIPSSGLPDGIIDDDGNIIDPDAIKIYGYVYSDEEVEESIIGYFPMEILSYNKDNDYFVVRGELKTDEYITMDGKLRIVDSVYPNGETIAYDHITPFSKIRMGIGIYFKDSEYTDKGSYDGIVPDMDDYGLLNVYSNDRDRATFMIDMTRIIRSVVTLNNAGDGNVTFTLKQVPLVRYSDLRSQMNRISEIIHNTNSTVSAMLELIKNNSSIDYKFYATYGKSRYFKLENTDIPLDRLDISLQFRVRLYATRIDSSIISDLRSFIQPLVEEVNVLDLHRSIYFSNIITQVENEFKYNQNRILSFELVKINNYDYLYQSITNTVKSLESMSKQEMLDYVAEFIKLDFNRIKIDIIPI